MKSTVDVGISVQNFVNCTPRSERHRLSQKRIETPLEVLS